MPVIEGKPVSIFVELKSQRLKKCKNCEMVWKLNLDHVNIKVLKDFQADCCFLLNQTNVRDGRHIKGYNNANKIGTIILKFKNQILVTD